jgi:hypothetical protein
LTSFAHALTAFTAFWNSPGTSGLLTSAMMPTFMVVAVSPTSVPAALATGEAPVLAGADPLAEAAAEVAAADVLVLPLLLLDELHPAASRTAAASTATSAAKRVRLGVRRPVPPRPGPSLLGLTPVPSTTSLPVSGDPATPVRSRRR